MGKELSLTLKERNMKVIGGMTKPKAMEFMFTITMLDMKENGIKTSNMEKVQRNGKMGQCSLGSTGTERKTVSENMNGEMVLVMKVNGKRMRYQVMVTTHGQMVDNMWVIGRVT